MHLASAEFIAVLSLFCGEHFSKDYFSSFAEVQIV